MSIAPYRIMWIVVMFDLPVDSKQARKEYTRFRKTLLQLGMTMMQFSVYAKALPSEEAGDCLSTVVHMALPPKGEVRILKVTDRQFGKMEVFTARKTSQPEQIPDQIGLF
jgi:CRISPR-associated protein Cas2